MAGYDALKKELPEMAKIVAQFPEGVQAAVLASLTEAFIGAPTEGERAPAANAKPSIPATADKQAPKDSNKKKTPRSSGKKAAGKESYQIDRELNLRGDKSIPSFSRFIEEKRPKSSWEFNATAVYYLSKMLGHASVTLNHVFTCYKEVNRRPPQHFRQSFTDTKNKAGWIEFAENGDLVIPHRGVVYVEHDLPKADKAPKEK